LVPTIGIDMTSNAESGPASGHGHVGASGPTRSLWLHLLKLSSGASAAGLALCAVPAALLDGAGGALSSSAGGLLVMLFFGISLLVGHLVGRSNPSGAIGVFVATYFIKVVGFAAVLFVVGAPQWLHARWFVAGAVTAVVLWQAAEIFGFSKARLQIYNDPEPKETPDA
jgi:ATP synthase protein I